MSLHKYEFLALKLSHYMPCYLWSAIMVVAVTGDQNQIRVHSALYNTVSAWSLIRYVDIVLAIFLLKSLYLSIEIYSMVSKRLYLLQICITCEFLSFLHVTPKPPSLEWSRENSLCKLICQIMPSNISSCRRSLLHTRTRARSLITSQIALAIVLSHKYKNDLVDYDTIWGIWDEAEYKKIGRLSVLQRNTGV